jgi:hypothetical protein
MKTFILSLTVAAMVAASVVNASCVKHAVGQMARINAALNGSK